MLSCACLLASTAAAEPPAGIRPYDGIQAGLDAFRLAEEQRRAALAQQQLLNDQMRLWNGLPIPGALAVPSGSVAAAANSRGAAAISATASATSNWSVSNLEFAYGYGATIPWGAVVSAWGPPSVFEPWPFVPGDINGYPVVPPLARQPIGQLQTQTGPNRWESHPIYAPPLTAFQPQPPVESPLLDRTPYATPGPAADPALSADPVPPPPPPALPKSGPREY